MLRTGPVRRGRRGSPGGRATARATGRIVLAAAASAAVLVAATPAYAAARAGRGGAVPLTAAQDAAAQELLVRAVIVADELFERSTSYSGATTTAMAALDPSDTFVGSTTVLTSPGSVSVGTSDKKAGSDVVLATKSASPFCWYLRDVQGAPIKGVAQGLWISHNKAPKGCDSADAPGGLAKAWTQTMPSAVTTARSDDTAVQSNFGPINGDEVDYYQNYGSDSFAGAVTFLPSIDSSFNWEYATTASSGATDVSVDPVQLTRTDDYSGIISSVWSSWGVCWSMFIAEIAPSPAFGGVTAPGTYYSAGFPGSGQCSSSNEVASTWFPKLPSTTTGSQTSI